MHRANVKNCKTLILISLFLSSFLTGQVKTGVVTEIPHYKNGDISVFYRETHFHFSDLKMDSLEHGFDSLQIRFWYHWAFEKKEKMLQLSKTQGDQWAGKVYEFIGHGPKNERTDSIKESKVFPKDGWDNFIKKLNQQQISTLENMNDIKGLVDGWNDGWGCSIEIATKEKYRFYNYHLPELFQKDFWQAKNMVNILNIVQSEFGIRWNHD